MKSSTLASSSIVTFLKQMAGTVAAFLALRPPTANAVSTRSESRPETPEAEAKTDSLWLKALVRVLESELLRIQPHHPAEVKTIVTNYSANEIEALTTHEMLSLHGVIEDLASQFNNTLADYPELERLHVTTARLTEPISGRTHQEGMSNGGYQRCRATSASWSLILRGQSGLIDVFLVPANELLSEFASETNARLRTSLRLNLCAPEASWDIDLFSSQPSEKSSLMKQVFKELVLKSARQLSVSLGRIDALESDLETEAMEELFLAKQNMAQKLVSRHEELTHAIARDLHDVVIAELMLLKRSLASHNVLEDEQIADSLETLSRRLREICYDLAPRDLEDWGLQIVVEDLLERVGKRIGAEFSLEYEERLPRLEVAVQLHIYRIIQECLNNIAKYAHASKIEIKFALSDGVLVISIADNGKGFATPADRAFGLFEGGTGLSTINERTEMIRCFHPATLSISSDPGQGTIITIRINVFES